MRDALPDAQVGEGGFAPATSAARPNLAIVVLVAGGATVAVMQTLVAPLLPLFPKLLGASVSDVTWLATVSLLAGAVLTPILGRLADLYGRRRILLLALGLMTAGSTLGALAPGLGLLLVARALQGGALAVIPIGMSLMRDVLPAGRLPGGVAVMSASQGFGSALALPLSGTVAEFADWRWLFAGPALVGAVLMVATVTLLPEPPGRSPGRFDWIGAVLLAASLTCLLLGVSKLGTWGWGAVAGLLGSAAVLIPVSAWSALRTRSPLIDIRVSAARPVLFVNLTSGLIGFALYMSVLGIPLWLQARPATGYGLGLSVAESSLLLMPLGATSALISPLAATLARRYGARSILAAGAPLVAVGSLAMTTMPRSLVVLVAFTLVLATGTTLANAATPVLVMEAVPVDQTAAANSVNMLSRAISSSMSSAVIAVVVTAMAMTVRGGTDVPTRAAFVVLFVLATAAALVAFLLAIVLQRDHRRPVTKP
ncbi:MFS transporter [Streptomyces sp. NPDC051985]|uniref:MFS transporter n=1 Tax=Streptomyces sp. NPDC051985 TaxID=3155807 RepID=UPI00342D7D4E